MTTEPNEIEREGMLSDMETLRAEKRELRAEVEWLTVTLAYVRDMTYCGTDAEWHFKPGYDPQTVLDALERKP